MPYEEAQDAGGISNFKHIFVGILSDILLTLCLSRANTTHNVVTWSRYNLLHRITSHELELRQL